MIRAVGIDVIEIKRVEESLRRFGPRFRRRVFTDQECRYCDSHSEAHIHYAARFAAKEAMMKALGTGWGQGVEWRQIEVISRDGQPPKVALTGRASQLCRSARVHLSLSHSRSIAAAVVVLEDV
ncbi:MAG TPA: holo-ACP synthase [Acidobacteriota bacterium]|jgi:holo-[acyl-carrier protein] synthase|nr:holo-ACP synthase [Acidobacteriota bacterium]